MIQPKLFAQLGNQCFMISCAIAHALKMGTTYSIPKKTISPNTWRTYFSHLPETKSATLHYYKEKRHCYDPLPEVDSLTIEGYFQSEKYWHGYKDQIAEALGFVHKPEPYVAVHIRRGDYLKYPDQFPVMPIDYYEAALNLLRNKGYKKFRVYSDDILWCYKLRELGGWDFEFSNVKDPLTDMKDMYNAAGFILANSTFGLFPALLRSDNPMVIAPAGDRWFGPKAKHLETCDLMPERFIKI
jgi:hypothetical protein